MCKASGRKLMKAKFLLSYIIVIKRVNINLYIYFHFVLEINLNGDYYNY